MDTVVESHHAVLILDLTESPLEIEAEECTTESVRAAIPGVRIMTRDDFRRMGFYYGYPESEEESIKYFTMLAPWFLSIGIGPFCAPIAAAAFTETIACSGLGKAVATFLTGGNLPESASSTDQTPK